ncbi:DUF2934 domain-containing protein [Bradyrhizobium jicamae]|uniref:DUF2934 domain-containing protein n=1 Tax=Bradyrhizobium jicamae TaxID=280332 RepID=A0ABS5FU84_9BRAD|nr:DUF2934 domain-containing protein [Bradyrhizobium jicamae]MBR0800404.1 DUF2934 domain-containing protein [Bradyrhizobium jicamae]MBR0937872.1 DUF2934 domain-containing protein [Bradyrhizobium jicamae]
MPSPTEEQIRSRAYELWKNAGEPSGQMDTLWYQAEQELLSEHAANGEAPCDMNGHHKSTRLQ